MALCLYGRNSASAYIQVPLKLGKYIWQLLCWKGLWDFFTALPKDCYLDTQTLDELDLSF